MNYRFKPNDFVWLKLNQGPLRIMVLERVEGKLFYRLDWESCGFNRILNTVSISEGALYEQGN